MRNKKFTKKDLIKLLVKKASGFYYDEEQTEYEKVQNSSKNSQKIDKKGEKDIEIEKNLKKADMVSGKFDIAHDSIILSKEGNLIKNNDSDSFEKLILSKKKVSTHYIPPDMIAIKILFEIFEKKVDANEIENMTDEELFKLKTKLLEELKNEDKQNS